jgi:hypothetical protein
MLAAHLAACIHIQACTQYAHYLIPCRSCKLEPDSLHPLAQLHNLRELHLSYCIGLTTPALESFLRTAVQGSDFKVVVYQGTEAKEEMQAMYNSLVQSLGVKHVPRLHLQI